MDICEEKNIDKCHVCSNTVDEVKYSELLIGVMASKSSHVYLSTLSTML